MIRYWASFFILLFLSCSTSEPEKPVIPGTNNPDPPTTPQVLLPVVEDCGYEPMADLFEGWNLIFEDDFDNDLAKWTPWLGGAFNDELQLYKATNVFVENDYLYLKAQRAKVSGRTNPFNETIKNFDFASGRIESRMTFGPSANPGSQTVRFSARIRLVEGHGLWPAWWSYNDPWPTKGEIDILEARGNTPNEFQSNFHFGTNANQLDTDPIFNEFRYTHSENLSTCFHLYELEWSRDSFVIRFDGEIIKTYDQNTFEFVDDFFNKKHRLTLNLAVGGLFFSNLDVSQIPNESYLVVDWVRVYSK